MTITFNESVKFGDMKRIPLDEGQTAAIEAHPHRGFNCGNGPSRTVKAKIEGGVAGILIDARGRPFYLPEDKQVRAKSLLKWFEALDVYPMQLLEGYRSRGRE